VSGTTKPAEATKTVGQVTTKSDPSVATRNGVDHSNEASHLTAETVARAVDTAAAMSSKVVEEAREAMMAGVRTVASVGGHVANISFDRGHNLLASATHTMDIYRDASERSADGIQALFSSWMAMGRGLQQMQHTCLEIFDESMEHAVHKPQDLLRCKTIAEVAEVQRDLYVDAVSQAITSSSRLLEMMNNAARDAMRPLQNGRPQT
jgi:S-methylmethionine-dependent homocysteine/selenocysteine methylase